MVDRIPIYAGFDNGYLHWNDIDLALETQHTPHSQMVAHYHSYDMVGVRNFRDGLPWRHHALDRLTVAQQAKAHVIWDLIHFDPAPYNVLAYYMDHLVETLRDVPTPTWFCVMNEPSVVERLTRYNRAWALDTACAMMGQLRDGLRDPHFITCDPVDGTPHLAEQLAATEYLVARNPIDVVGINYYPDFAGDKPLHQILIDVYRYFDGKIPVMVAETGWHVGHPVYTERHPWCTGHAAWFNYVMSEAALAQQEGVRVHGVCVYPAVHTPSWNGDGARWDNGLIDAEGWVNHEFAVSLTDYIRGR